MTLVARKLELIQLLATEERLSALDMVEQALRTDVSDNDRQLSPEQQRSFESYLKKYNKEENLVDKLSMTYQFVDEVFEHSKDNAHQVLKELLTTFNDKNFHLSELKTLLVISKPFKEHETIKDARAALLETYQNKKVNA